MLNKLIQGEFIRNGKGLIVEHKVWFKTILNPFLQLFFGMSIVAKVNSKGEFISYEIRDKIFRDEPVTNSRDKYYDAHLNYLDINDKKVPIGREWDHPPFQFEKVYDGGYVMGVVPPALIKPPAPQLLV